MQTFLPYEDFVKSAEVLDYRRLGKQRVECLQLLNTLKAKRDKVEGTLAWGNHPALLMWEGYEGWLIEYGVIICQEWINRGYVDNTKPKIESFRDEFDSILLSTASYPLWLGDPDVHRSHQSALLYKDFGFYSKYEWDVEPALAYFWPVTKDRKYENNNHRIEV